MLDAADLLSLVSAKWGINPPIKQILREEVDNGGFEEVGLSGWTVLSAGATRDASQKYSGSYSVKFPNTPDGAAIYQLFDYQVTQSEIQTFEIYYLTEDILSSYGVMYILYEGWTAGDPYNSSYVTPYNLYKQMSWLKVDLKAALEAGKGKVIGMLLKQLVPTTNNWFDALTLTTTANADKGVLLQLDEYNPKDPLYQIVFINRPAKTMFVAPNVIKHEQDINIEIFVKLIDYTPSEVTTKRATFKAMKAELSRIFNTYRFDNVGSTINVSAWTDGKLSHGFGEDPEPLEFTSRLTVQVFYYEATDGSSIGVRVGSVRILGSDLLGVVEADWSDTNPWVNMQIPKGILHKQHLLGPQIEGVVTTHDYKSLYSLLYQTPIAVGGVQYPILVDGTKIKFSTDIPNTPQFTIKQIDHNGDIYTFDFYNVRIKQVTLEKSVTTGMVETVWKISWSADYMYYTAPA